MCKVLNKERAVTGKIMKGQKGGSNIKEKETNNIIKIRIMNKIKNKICYMINHRQK